MRLVVFQKCVDDLEKACGRESVDRCCGSCIADGVIDAPRELLKVKGTVDE